MTILAEMNRVERADWLGYHALMIRDGRDEFIEAAQKYGKLLAKCNGAFERDATTAEVFVDAILDRADASLADELRRDLGL